MTAINTPVTVSMKAAADISTSKYRAVILSGDLTVNALTSSIDSTVCGLLQDWPLTDSPNAAGRPAAVAVSGPARGELGASLSAGAVVGPEQATGKLIAAVTGHYPIGRLITGGADGELAWVDVNVSTLPKA